MKDCCLHRSILLLWKRGGSTTYHQSESFDWTLSFTPSIFLWSSPLPLPHMKCSKTAKIPSNDRHFTFQFLPHLTQIIQFFCIHADYPSPPKLPNFQYFHIDQVSNLSKNPPIPIPKSPNCQKLPKITEPLKCPIWRSNYQNFQPTNISKSALQNWVNLIDTN